MSDPVRWRNDAGGASDDVRGLLEAAEPTATMTAADRARTAAQLATISAAPVATAAASTTSTAPSPQPVVAATPHSVSAPAPSAPAAAVPSASFAARTLHKVLANGIVLDVVENHQVPTVAVGGVLLAGDMTAPADQSVVNPIPDLSMPADLLAPPCLVDGDCHDTMRPRCDVAGQRCVPCLPVNDNCPIGSICGLTG